MLLNEAENAAASEFAAKHYKDHCASKNRAASIRLSAVQSGVGYLIMVKCPYCKEEKDITDYEVW
jgi:hypothetical protein